MTEFLVGTGSPVGLPANSTLVILYGTSGGKMVKVIGRDVSGSYVVSVGCLYYVFSSYTTLATLMSGVDELMGI